MTQRTVRVELKIKSATVENVDDKLVVKAIWTRGNNAVDTRKRKLGPGHEIAKFNDTFQMKTNMDFDIPSGKFYDKPSTL